MTEFANLHASRVFGNPDLRDVLADLVGLAKLDLEEFGTKEPANTTEALLGIIARCQVVLALDAAISCGFETVADMDAANDRTDASRVTS